MSIHEQGVAKTNQRFNSFHRNLKLKLFIPLALLVIALPLVWLNFNTKALASSGTECQYVPTWLIEVKSGQSKTSKFFSGWSEVEPMLAYVEQQSLPSPGQHITLTISDGGLCFDGSNTAETASSTKCPTSTMPTNGPTWNVTICNLNGLLLHQEY